MQKPGLTSAATGFCQLGFIPIDKKRILWYNFGAPKPGMRIILIPGEEKPCA